MMLFGRGRMQSCWLVSNLCWECSDNDVEEILPAAAWDAKALHPLYTRGGNKSIAAWVARADAPPPKITWRVKFANREA